jgi:hypothetical protein
MRSIWTALVALSLASGCAPKGEPHEGASAEHEGRPHFGDQMDAIGRRFERLGRAGIAGRWEFARYQIHELRENFEEIENSPVPDDLKGADVPLRIQALTVSALPALDSALVRQDSTAFRLMFRRAAQECNACHESAARAFVEVPETPGVPVPMLGPITSALRDHQSAAPRSR